MAFASVGSTNDEAKRLAETGAAAGLIVTADTQSRGRGRRGRGWLSLPGNLYVSILLRPKAAPRVISELALVAGLAVAEEVTCALGRPAAKLKWPNDVLVNDRKIAGVLLESKGTARETDWVVVGIGVNVTDAPVGADLTATCLRASGCGNATAEGFLEALLVRLDVYRRLWEERGFTALRERWSACAHGRGDLVEVDLGGERRRGRLLDIDDHGGLVLESVNGQREILSHGDMMLACG
jgi:BirA family biotin operon repressor/biotin-[acetyl-CoA-carboxylase] ligase